MPERRPWADMFEGAPREWLEYYLWIIIQDVPANMVGGHHQVYERKGDSDKVYSNDPLRLNTHARSIAAKACSARDALDYGRARKWGEPDVHPLIVELRTANTPPPNPNPGEA